MVVLCCELVAVFVGCGTWASCSVVLSAEWAWLGVELSWAVVGYTSLGVWDRFLFVVVLCIELCGFCF